MRSARGGKRRVLRCDPMQRCRALPGAVGALCRALPPRARLAPDVLRRARFDRPQAVSPGRDPPSLPSSLRSPCGAALYEGWLNSSGVSEWGCAVPHVAVCQQPFLVFFCRRWISGGCSMFS